MKPPAVPIERLVRVVVARTSPLPLVAKARAQRFVAPIEMNSKGFGAESEMLLAGPKAASSSVDSRPTNAASMSDMSAGDA